MATNNYQQLKLKNNKNKTKQITTTGAESQKQSCGGLSMWGGKGRMGWKRHRE